MCIYAKQGVLYKLELWLLFTNQICTHTHICLLSKNKQTEDLAILDLHSHITVTHMRKLGLLPSPLLFCITILPFPLESPHCFTFASWPLYGFGFMTSASPTILCLAGWDLVLHSYPGVKILLKRRVLVSSEKIKVRIIIKYLKVKFFN